MEHIKENRVKYTTSIKSKDFKFIDASNYDEMCQSANCYECIPDDKPIKPYFDIDIKEHDYEDECVSSIIEIAKACLDSRFKNAKYSVLNSSSQSYLSCKTHKMSKIISLHIIIPNYKIMKNQLLEIVSSINKEQMQIQLIQSYVPSLEPSFKIFDESVYDANRKLRSAYANKDNGEGVVENRPFQIVEGTFEDSVISEFIPNDAILIPCPVIQTQLIQPPVKMTMEAQTENELFFKIAIENGFLRNHKERTDWIKVGCALHYSITGDNGLALFDEYSKLYPSYYNYDGVVKTWDSLRDINDAQKKPTTIATIHKMCKDENLDTYKQVIAKVKQAMKQQEVVQLESTIDQALTYAEMKIEFEKTHFKVIDTALFMTIQPSGDINIQNKQSLLVSYEHLRFEKIVKCEIVSMGFVAEWLKDPSIRRYDSADVYPPDQVCPSNVFNLWVPFAMEKITEWTHHQSGLDAFRKHILIMCNNEKHIANYFELWIAQMIQFPSIKTICPTIISAQGAGKGTTMQGLIGMLGQSKVLNEMTNPSRDVWGNFNSLMKQAFLVNVDELSGKDSRDAVGQIKALIKSKTISINSKGQAPIIINSYHRFLNTTNNSDPVSVSKDDRRNCVIRASDELLGNTVYFKQMYELLADVNVIKTCYEYFKALPGADNFNALSIPHTEYHEEMSELSVSPIESWLRDYTEEFYNSASNELGNTVKVQSSRCFEMFNEWKDKTHISYEVNSLKFAVQLNRLKIDGIETKKEKQSNCKVFNLQKMAVYFKI